MNGITRAVSTLAGAAVRRRCCCGSAAQIGRGSDRRLLGRLRRRRRGRARARAVAAARPHRQPARAVRHCLPAGADRGRLGADRAASRTANWFSGPRARPGPATSAFVRRVLDIGTWIGVLAFGIGFTLGDRSSSRAPRRRRIGAAPYDEAAADEPVAAERHELGRVTTETDRLRPRNQLRFSDRAARHAKRSQT